MEAASETLSLKQACAVARVGSDFAEREIEHRTLIPLRRRRRGVRRKSVELTKLSVVFLALARNLLDADVELSRTSRKDLFQAISTGKDAGRWRHADTGALVLDGSPLTLSIAEIASEIMRRCELLVRGVAERVEKREGVRGGEPVFAGTRVPLAKVGALRARGVAVAALLEQFPALNADDVELAEMVHDLGRRPGRPRSKRPVRRKKLKLRRSL